jgi:ribosomal protein S6
MAEIKKYQLNCLISPELNQKELEDFLKKIESLLLKAGEILKTEIAQKIKLRYPIRKKNEAFLTTFDFKGEAEKVENFKKEIEEEKNILRYLLIKNKERKTKIEDLKKIKKSAKKLSSTSSLPAFAEALADKPTDNLPAANKSCSVKASADVKTLAGNANGKEKVEFEKIEEKLKEIIK